MQLVRKEKKKSRKAPLEHARFASLYRTEIYICLGLILATLLVFAQVGSFEFVNLDDNRNIYNNPAIRNGLTFDSIVWAFTATNLDYWHPLPWLSHMLDVQLFGMNAGWHHLTSVFLHILNVLLLFVVLRRMTGAVWRSAIVAALFAIHPLRAESVAWVTERKDVLAGLFWWLTTWAYLGYVRNNGTWKRYALVIAGFAMGLMSKPVVMTLPFFLLLLDYWPLGRLRAATVSKLVIEKVPLFALTAVSVVLTFKSQQQIGAMRMDLPLAARIGNSLVAYAQYLVDMVWPYPLAAIYPYTTAPGWQVAEAGLLLAVITMLVIRKMSVFPYLVTGWLWYLGVLLPVSGVVQMGLQSRADRFTYLPLTGVFVMLVWGLGDAMADWRYRRPSAVIVVVVLMAFGVRAWSQVGYWHDSITLFRENVSVTPENKWALNNLGEALTDAGKTDEAIASFRKALRVDPKYQPARSNLGSVLAEKGKLDDALANFTEALRLEPGFAAAHYYRGFVLTQMGRYQEAAAEYEAALRLGVKPGLAAQAQTQLGAIRSQEGKSAEAIALYSAALNTDPSFTLARRNLAIVLTRLGRTEEAIQQLSILLSVDPNDRQAREVLNQLSAQRRR